MEVQTIQQRLIEFLRSVTGQTGLAADSELLDQGIVDSLTMMDLMVHIETEFAVRLEFADLRTENFRTAHALAALVASRRGDAPRRDAA